MGEVGAWCRSPGPCSGHCTTVAAAPLRSRSGPEPCFRAGTRLSTRVMARAPPPTPAPRPTHPHPQPGNFFSIFFPKFFIPFSMALPPHQYPRGADWYHHNPYHIPVLGLDTRPFWSSWPGPSTRGGKQSPGRGGHGGRLLRRGCPRWTLCGYDPRGASVPNLIFFCCCCCC